jgi:hypothetical protein
MAKDTSRDKREKAHDLADEAIDRMIEGDRPEGGRMLDKARRMDEKAVEEVAREVEEERRQAEDFRKEE